MWRDLFRLGDIECKYLSEFDLGAFFSKEVVGDVNMPHSGEQEPCVEGSSRLVDSE